MLKLFLKYSRGILTEFGDFPLIFCGFQGFFSYFISYGGYSKMLCVSYGLWLLLKFRTYSQHHQL